MDCQILGSHTLFGPNKIWNLFLQTCFYQSRASGIFSHTRKGYICVTKTRLSTSYRAWKTDNSKVFTIWLLKKNNCLSLSKSICYCKSTDWKKLYEISYNFRTNGILGQNQCVLAYWCTGIQHGICPLVILSSDVESINTLYQAFLSSA